MSGAPLQGEEFESIPRDVSKRPKIAKNRRLIYLADFLQNTNDALEVTNVESWQYQSDMAEMPVANLKSATAGVAGAGLVRYTHAPVERAILHDSSIMFQVEQLAIRDFNNGLADDVIVGPKLSHVHVSNCQIAENRIPTKPIYTYITPNFSSLITLGTRSMTWALPRSTCTASGGCIAVVTGRAWQKLKLRDD